MFTVLRVFRKFGLFCISQNRKTMQLFKHEIIFCCKFQRQASTPGELLNINWNCTQRGLKKSLPQEVCHPFDCYLSPISSRLLGLSSSQP